MLKSKKWLLIVFTDEFLATNQLPLDRLQAVAYLCNTLFRKFLLGSKKGSGCKLES